MSSSYCISLDKVKEAASRIEGVAHKTPVLTSSSFDANDQQFFFKVEALQRTGSFKFRGALNAIKAQNPTSVVTHSSGNHAAAVALAAKLASTNNGNTITATIVMPRNAPAIKQTAVKGFDGNIVLVDNTNEAREDEAERLEKETGALFVHPSEDPFVIAGQGTVCLEMVSQVKQMMNDDLDAVIIPVGGGGLASGNTIALRGLLGNKVKIILAEPTKLDDAKRSFEAGQLLKHDPNNKLDSVADGLKTTLGPNTWPIVRDLVDDIYTVSEEEILKATKLVWERLKICIEPSAGVGVAVSMGKDFQKKYSASNDIHRVGVILCGGNVDIIKTAKQMEAIGL